MFCPLPSPPQDFHPTSCPDYWLMGEGRGGGITCFWSWLSWAERLSMRTRDCCSSSWAAPTRLLFLSADCLALSSWRGGHRVRAAATKGGRDLRRASLLQPQVPATLSSCHRPPDLPQDISGWAGGGLLGAEAARETRENEHLGRIGLLQFLLVLFHLVLVLGPQLLQGIRQPALKLTLLPIINLHQARLMAALGLTKLLEGLDPETKIRTSPSRMKPKFPAQS